MIDLAKASLEDKYTLERGRVFLTGTQALIRLMMLQRERDLRAGLNTAGFISGYRGSPLGGLDQALWRAQPHLASHHLKFQPGLHGFAMSRYSGCWIAFKCVTDVVESGASVIVDPDRVVSKIPQDFALPPGGLNIRWPDAILEQEARILDYKVYAALAYCRANGLDRMIWDSPRARLGIVTTGKSFGDVMRALAELGIDERVEGDIGLWGYADAL